MNVDLFVPCFIDQVNPEIAVNMVKVLRHLGCEVNYNKNQTCCGQPAYNSGFELEAKAVAQKFIADFEGKNFIVAPSGSCTGYIRNYYTKMFKNSSEATKAKLLQTRIYEFAEFVVEHLDYQKLLPEFNATVTYHDGCGALRECGIKSQPRTLLSLVKGLELVEMKECETCCGFGGTFAVKYEPISTGMAYTKVQSAIDAGAKYMISSDFSCLMHINSYIQKQNSPLKTMHIADVLAMNL